MKQRRYKTLQGIINEASRHPERYGHGHWYIQNKPVCPLAQLAMLRKPVDGSSYPHIAAKYLGIDVDSVCNFVYWWDYLNIPNFKLAGIYRRKLQKEGYTVPLCQTVFRTRRHNLRKGAKV